MVSQGLRKCLPINLLDLSKRKEEMLRETYSVFFSMVKESLDLLHKGGVKTRTELYRAVYRKFRDAYGASSRLVELARVSAWGLRKTMNGELKSVPIRWDGRIFSIRETERGNPVLSLRLKQERVGIPIRQDGAYSRLQDHTKDGWRVTSVIMRSDLRFQAVLKKDAPTPTPRARTLGVDFNSSKIAVSVLDGKRVLRQLYFGQDLASRQFRFEKRRGKLCQHRDTEIRDKAGMKLKDLSRSQRNYVRTRCWQVSNEIVKLAQTYGADVAIERLRNIRKRKGEWSREGNRKVNRMPYGFFRFALNSVGDREGVRVLEINPRYTSQTCPRCGEISKKNWVGYSYFRCRKCGYEADRDRVASLNIAQRAASLTDHQKGQIPLGNASLGRRVLRDEGGFGHDGVSPPPESQAPVLEQPRSFLPRLHP